MFGMSTELMTKGKDFNGHRRDSSTLFSFYKNLFYKNMEAELCEILIL